MKLVSLLDTVRRRLRNASFDVARGGDLNPMDVDLVATETVRAMGFEINARTGEIYDPSREDDKLSIANMRTTSVRYAGAPKRRR